jgi:hypothetical protein
MRHGLKKTKTFFTLFIALFVLLSAVPLTSAANNPAVNKKVYLTKASYIQLIDANLIPSTKGATASFTFTFYNGDSSQINLVDYWARMTSKGGTKYTLTLLDQDKKKKVAPKSSTNLTFYSEVGSKVTLDQLIVKIIKFDFSVAGYEKAVAQYTFPAGYSNYIAANGYKSVLINNTTANVRVDQINVTKKDKNYDFNLTYAVRNTSKFGVTLPQYNYYMQTSKGLYKLALRNKTDETLQLEPTVLNAVRLTGSIPATVPTTGWKLIITESVGAETSKVELPVAIFDTPFKVGSTVVSSQAAFTNDTGTYEVNLTSINRLPWTTEDNIIAEVTIKNKESVYLPLPDLAGLLVVDENIKLNAQLIKNKSDIGLAPGASTTVHYVGSIPYDYTWKQFNIKLSEKEGETTTEVATLTKSTIAATPFIKLNSEFTQNANGSQISGKVTNVRTYKSETTEQYAVYVDVTNKQNRGNTLPVWAGYFKSSDGNFYEAKFVKTTNTIKPGNKEQLIVYAELPLNVDKSSLQLLIGQAYDANGIMTAAGTPKGFYKAAQLALPVETTTTDSFAKINVGPYTFDMTYLNAFLDGNLLDMDLGATVTKDASYDGYSQSTITIELHHEKTNNVIYTQVIDMDGKAEGALKWKEGSNFTEIKKELTGTAFWNEYTFNIYETLNGNRKLLASKPISWNINTNWLDGLH